jgi:hypothetical protein
MIACVVPITRTTPGKRNIIIGSRPLPNPRRRLGHGLLRGLRRKVEELPLSFTQSFNQYLRPSMTMLPA